MTSKKVNNLTATLYTDGHPHSITIVHKENRKDGVINISHTELSDLIYILEYLKSVGVAKMPDIYKHEY